MTDRIAPVPDFDAAAHLAALERGLGLVIDPQWRAGVEANIAAIAKAAELVAGFPLPDEIESSAVFEVGR